MRCAAAALPQVDLADDARQQVVHLDVDQRRHLDVLAVVRVGDRLPFCNETQRYVHVHVQDNDEDMGLR